MPNNFTLKFYFLLALGFLFSTFSFSQGKLTVGLDMGIADYIGDVKHLEANPQEWGSAFGISAAYHLNSRWQLQLGLIRGTIQGDDKFANDPLSAGRNLSFRNNLIEFSTVLKWNILTEPKIQVYSRGKTHFTPYLFAGVAVVYSNPKAQLEQDWFSLQPLGTEGQYIPGSGRTPYSLTQASIPLGAGISYRMGRVTLSMDVGLRTTFTDYLDDVSTTYPDQNQLLAASGSIAAQLSRRTDQSLTSGAIRGNPDSNDAYFFSLFRIGYTLGR